MASVDDTTVLRESQIPANSVRVPEPEPGTATMVHRYQQDRAVVLHPDDYGRLIKDSRLVAFLGQVEPMPPATPVERKTHALVSTPGAEAPVLEDFDALTAWLAYAEE